jgi:lysophospholipase L1-like esterase
MDRTLVAYGHSWVTGRGASNPRLCLVEIAARLMGMTPKNLGVSGSSSDHTAELVRRDGVPLAPTYLLMTGLNDARTRGEDPEALDKYACSVRTILDACAVSPQGWIGLVEQPPLVDYSLHPPHDRGSTAAVHAYNARLNDVASGYPQAVVVAVGEWDAASMHADDTVHPNDLGHAAIGIAIAAAMRQPI